MEKTILTLNGESNTSARKVCLLDLNYTLAKNAKIFFETRDVSQEIYRKWLLDLLYSGNYYVVLITARLPNVQEATLNRIEEETGYRFAETFFKPSRKVLVHDFKPKMLLENVDRWKKIGDGIIAIESNMKTRCNYLATGVDIKVICSPRKEETWQSLSEGLISREDGKRPSDKKAPPQA